MKLISVWKALGLLSFLAAVAVLLLRPSVGNSFSAPVHISGYQTDIKLPYLTVTDHNQQPLNWHSLKQRPLFITTGFTHCGYACPTTMLFYQQLAEQLNHQASFVLLTIDPERDTSERLKSYLSNFDERFIGIRTEDTNALQLFMKQLKQAYGLNAETGQLQHQNTIYLIHPNAKGMILYTETLRNVDKISQDFKELNKLRG
jgi:protein SCO1/2